MLPPPYMSPPAAPPTKLALGPLLVTHPKGCDVYLSGVAYQTEVMASQNAYEVKATVLAASHCHLGGHKPVLTLIDAEPVKPDKNRPFHDIRTLRVLHGAAKYSHGDEFPLGGSVKYHIFEARKRFDLDAGKPARTTIPLRCAVQVHVKPGRWECVMGMWKRLNPDAGMVRSNPITLETTPEMVALALSR